MLNKKKGAINVIAPFFIYKIQNTGYFKTPSNPPKNLSFSYGTDERPSSLLVRAFFETDKENTYSIVSKELILEAKDEWRKEYR